MSEYESTIETPGGDAFVSKEDRTLGMAAHLVPAIVQLLSGGTLGWVVPLVIYFVKKDESEFVTAHAKESLNLQITTFLLAIIGVILVIICVGIPFLIALAIYEIVFGVIAGIQAYDGKPYRYPFCVRLIQ